MDMLVGIMYILYIRVYITHAQLYTMCIMYMHCTQLSVAINVYDAFVCRTGRNMYTRATYMYMYNVYSGLWWVFPDTKG